MSAARAVLCTMWDSSLHLKERMSFRTVFILVIVGFCLFCGWLVVDSGVLHALHAPVGADAGAAQAQGNSKGCILLQQTADVATGAGSTEPNSPTAAKPPAAQLQPARAGDFSADGGPLADIRIGSVDPDSGFKFQLELDSRGAAIRTATFSEFDDRDYKNPQPLVFLSPVQFDKRWSFLPMANEKLQGTLLDQNRRFTFPLGRLSWKALGVQKLDDGGQAVSFEATILDSDKRPVLKLTKTYRIHPDTYLLDITLNLENLADQKEKVQYDLTGPAGLEREKGYRMEMRKIVAGFKSPQGQVTSVRTDIKTLAKAGGTMPSEELLPRSSDAQFLWAAAVNKYFAAILVPMAEGAQPSADWVASKRAILYNPDQDRKAVSGDETLGVDLSSVPVTLSPAGQTDSTKSYGFQLYLGPKDKSYFDKDPLYRQLGFVQTIDFMNCCCPATIINPLAFGILAIMKWMYGFWPHNYGIVIIILVFVMRLILHPLVKKSQVSMHHMTKLAPRAEEIKKKYAGNKAEMNKKLIELYREQGASPIMGMLPMLVQMPIWIALWSAVYTSIDLRGAPFLPFWITDLSAADAVWRFPAITIPLVNWTIESLNLLPILMGVAFYLQQKLMPTQSAATTNPQMAQQQKMMMIMLPLIMPLALYNAPSGVNLYIMASTFAGVIESYVIKKHIDRKEQEDARGTVAATSKTGGKVKKKKPKPFFKF